MLFQALSIEVRLDLIHCRNCLIEVHQVNEPVGIEVGDSDCTDLPLAVHRFEVAPCGIDVAIGPMQQDKVNVVCAELLH